MSQAKALSGFCLILALAGCGLASSSKQKQTPPPASDPWILSAPQPAQQVNPEPVSVPSSASAPAPLEEGQVFSVKNPDSLEARIEKLEHDMAGLKLQLAQIDQRYGLNPEPPKPLVTAPKRSPKKVQKALNQKTGVRFGLHGSKTRIVVDLPHAVKFATDLDNQEKFFIIELHDSNLNLKSGIGIGLISSYGIDTDTDGVTRLIFNLKADAKLTAKEGLRPSGRYGHRVFVDLAKN